MKTKHTKGPWEFKKGGCWTIFADGESIMGDMQYYPWCPANEADWHLIAAAPTMLEALKKRTENEEQRIFEEWLRSERPSGDHDEVNRQWLTSSDYIDFCDEWGTELDAIAKATGGQQ